MDGQHHLKVITYIYRGTKLIMNQNEFNRLLLKTDSDADRLHFIHKYFFHGTPYIFQDMEHEYFEFRNRIANHFDIGFHEIFIVGSSKFGFSYFKDKAFDYDSDIDVVIVNERLFEDYYVKICDYQYQLDRMYKSVSQDEMRIYSKFLKYLIKGWMRPDKLPTSFKVDLLKSEWFNFFKSISYDKSEVGNYKVAGGLYKNYNYLEKYYLKSIEEYYQYLMSGKKVED